MATSLIYLAKVGFMLSGNTGDHKVVRTAWASSRRSGFDLTTNNHLEIILKKLLWEVTRNQFSINGTLFHHIDS
jgi:hypothetical protein